MVWAAGAEMARRTEPGMRRLVLTLGISIGLHLAAIATLPGLSMRATPEPRRLEVFLTAAARAPALARERAVPVESTPAPRAQEVAPETRLPPRRLPPRPIHRKVIEQAAEPAKPVPERARVDAAPPRPAAPPPASLPAAAVAAMRPVAPQPVPPSIEPSAQALAHYGQAVAQLLARNRQYPGLARLRGWEGEVTLRLEVTPDGRLVAATLERSSGHPVLDRQALDMARSLSRLPPPPQGLRERDFAVVVPVVFELAPEGAGAR